MHARTRNGLPCLSPQRVSEEVYTTTFIERLINIFMRVWGYILSFIQKISSKSKSSVLTDCSELDSEIILSECRIVGALEGTRLELGVRLVTLQLYLLVQYSSSELQELQVLVC